MEQLTLTDLLAETAQPHARRSDPATSHAAAASISRRTQVTCQQAVLACLTMLRCSDDVNLCVTYERIAGHHGWPVQSQSGIRTRRSELVAAGLVVDTGRKVTLASGRQAVVWAVVQQGGSNG